MKNFSFIFVFFIFLVQFSLSGEGAEFETKISPLIELYETGFYKEASQKLKDLLYPEVELVERENEILARQYLSFCYVLLDEKEKARREFLELLYVAPEIEFSPQVYLPEIVKIFQEAKKEWLEERKERADLSVKKGIFPPEEQRGMEKSEQEGLKKRKKFTPAIFLPGGYFQFRKGEKIKGWLILGSEVISLASSILAYELKSQLYHPQYKAYPLEKYDQAKQLREIQIASLAVFLGIYVYGVIDGWLK
jgi:hypothetical protein